MTRILFPDVPRQPIIEVEPRSSSVWNPLLTSTLNRINPVIDRWKGSLDVILVFVSIDLFTLATLLKFHAL